LAVPAEACDADDAVIAAAERLRDAQDLGTP
jgi:hypothetical protein